MYKCSFCRGRCPRRPARGDVGIAPYRIMNVIHNSLILFANKHLGPVISFLDISHADSCKGRIQNIFPVSG